MAKQYLVTGGAGFIGSHIAETLLKRGDKVRVLDNFSTGKPGNVPAGAELFEASITDLKKMAKAFNGIDGVFHTAALARVQESIDNPFESNEANITGTLNVIQASSRAGVRRIVFSSSSSIYGDTLILPTPENVLPNPKSPYALQKYVGEGYLKLATIFWGLQTVSLRYFNVYGPRMPLQGAYKLVIPIFLDQKAQGYEMTITSDGTQTRDFTHVDDVVRANLLAMDSSSVGSGEAINIGTGVNYSVNQVAKLIGGPTTHIPPRVEPHDTLADISRAKELLGWEPEVEFEEGLKRTMEWYETMTRKDTDR
ncbi:NAD-dependent epimerase/dehydratase family protein [Candidatus Uhrbacteria bacterium]|nr:NAD-dependent epimerase/dehydratase family protein [Candidatus Uhrbacteria bacterium]